MSEHTIPAHLKPTLARLAAANCADCYGTGVQILSKRPSGYREVRCGCCDRKSENSAA